MNNTKLDKLVSYFCFIGFLGRMKYMVFQGLLASIHNRYIDRKDGRGQRSHKQQRPSVSIELDWISIDRVSNDKYISRCQQKTKTTKTILTSFQSPV